jgi:hypothetical protein
MPTYYFDTTINDDVARDTEGVVLEGNEAARQEAIATLCGLAAEADPKQPKIHVVVAVLDEHRTSLLSAEIRLSGP